MSDITEWSPIDEDDANKVTPPNGFPEPMAAGLVNNSSRAVMGAVRRFAEDGGWLDWGHTVTQVDDNTVTINPGQDLTNIYQHGRRVRFTQTPDPTVYGFVTNYDSVTGTAICALDDGVISATVSNAGNGVSVGSDIQSSPLARSPLVLKHKEVSGIDGGTATAGAWETRTINNTDGDTTYLTSLSGNQFILAPGRYHINAWLTASRCGRYQSRIYNVTIGTPEQEELGGPLYLDPASPSAGVGHITAVFQIDAPGEILELQSQVSNTQLTSGYGVSANFGVPEIYIAALIWRVNERWPLTP